MSGKKIVVLGAGMVGSAIAWDLRRMGYDVTVVDARDDALGRMKARADVHVLRADLSDANVLTATIAPFDVVVGALSSRMGFETLRKILLAKKNYVDISFMAEDAWDLDPIAKENGVVAIIDMGVGPGMSNVICGFAAKHMNPCERIEILVGGLPAVRRWPFEYKAPFAPSDVIEEYVRPARIVENGRVVSKEALSEPVLFDFDGVGTLEAFNTDGLRSLTYSLKVPNMRERTMRYPGHIELMRVFRDTGLFSEEPVDVRGQAVVPRDLTAKLLFPKWTYEEGEEDLTVMRIAIDGIEDGVRVRRTWDLFDRADPVTKLRSMSRTTGFPATIAVDLVARGVYAEPGVHPPEDLGRVDGLLEHFVKELAARGVRFTERREQLA